MGIKKRVIEQKIKIRKTVKKLLTKGVTPEKLGLTVMLAIIFGTIPVIGINSVILAFIALRLRLNMVIIQVLNYAMYPLQLVLLIPFFKAGQWMFRTKSSMDVSISDYIELFSTNFFHAASEFSFMILKGITVWLFISIPVGILIYSIFAYFFRNLLVQIAEKRR